MRLSTYEIILPILDKDGKEIADYRLMVNGLYGAYDIVAKGRLRKNFGGQICRTAARTQGTSSPKRSSHTQKRSGRTCRYEIAFPYIQKSFRRFRHRIGYYADLRLQFPLPVLL